MNPALRVLLVGVVVGLSLGCGGGHAGKKKAHRLTKESQEIMDKQDAGDIRGLCVKPQKHQNKWNVMTIDKSGQAAACEWLEQHNAESFVKLQAEVATLNGLDCLKRVEQHWVSNNHRDDWQMASERDEARRAKYAPIAEPCVAALEQRAAAEPPVKLFLALRGHEMALRQSALSEPQRTRLKPLLTTVPAGAQAAWDARGSALVKDQPLAGALYLAAAAVAANAAGDRAARDTLLHRADAATHAAGAPEKLSVTLTGDLADKIKASNGQHYLFVDKGELTLAVQLGQARFEYGQRSVTRSGTRTVKAGLKENPDFKIRKHECQKLENDALNKEDSCRRNGGFAGTCDWARKYRQRAGECWGRMKGMNDLVEDTREERIDYPATEFFAKAAGSVTIAKDGGAPQTQDLTASTSNLGHGSVPALGLSGSSGRKVTEDEIDGSYRVEAMSKVENLMASGRSGLKQKLREQATAAPADLSAASLVRLCLVGGGTPANEFLDAQDSKYELPTRRVLETLLAAHNKQTVSW